VGHHLDHRLVFLDDVAFLDVPLDDLALGHALADVRQLEFPLRHRQNSTVFLMAGRMRCASGRYSFSRVYGNGVSKPVTRAGGASRCRKHFSVMSATISP